MSRVTVRLPDIFLERLNAAVAKLDRSRAEIIRHAIERYLDDFDDHSIAVDRLADPNDPVLDWDEVKREHLDPF
ncbi:MAG: ribbon-helix-helix domain-containing protein [Gammaproteobacteria bacterium]|nr:ribbon-helix-helix domain-containing protein [Gammaproteobacteria bacterium]